MTKPKAKFKLKDHVFEVTENEVFIIKSITFNKHKNEWMYGSRREVLITLMFGEWALIKVDKKHKFPDLELMTKRQLIGVAYYQQNCVKGLSEDVSCLGYEVEEKQEKIDRLEKVVSAVERERDSTRMLLGKATVKIECGPRREEYYHA